MEHKQYNLDGPLENQKPINPLFQDFISSPNVTRTDKTLVVKDFYIANDTEFINKRGQKVGRLAIDTRVTGSVYSLAAQDYLIGLTHLSYAPTIGLPKPSLAGVGKLYSIKDEVGGAATTTITIVSAGEETIDGSSSTTISTNYDTKDFYTDGANWFTKSRIVAAANGTDLFSTTYKVEFIPLTDGYWTEVLGGTGTATLDRYGIRLLTTLANDVAQIGTNRSLGPIGYDQNIKVRFNAIVNYLSANNNINYLYTMMDSASLTAATKYAGFRFSRSGGVNTILAVSKDGTTEETTDVTSTYGDTLGGTNTGNVWTIELTANTNVKFYKNGTLIATHSTNFPPSSDTTSEVHAFGARVEAGATGGSNEVTPINTIIAQVSF